MATTTEELRRTWETPAGIRGWLTTVDHKEIGAHYLATAFVFLILGGVLALVLRIQLAAPGLRLLSPETYNQFFSTHGVTMIFFYASPILSGFSNYLVPLLCGARDMAFPRLNAFTYWAFLLAGIFLYASFLIGAAPDAGWFAYAPLTEPPYSSGLNLDFYALALLFLTISTTVGAINFIVTIFKLRAPGMSVDRMPLLLWSTLTISVSIVFALPSLTAALVFLELDRKLGMHFFDAAAGGSPLLWQHLFWMFGHPWVYIVVLPAIGMAAMVLPTFCRRPMVGHIFVALAAVTTGLVGFGVWVHHMFATGLPALSMSFFSGASMTVVIPSGVTIFAFLATIWGGRLELTTPFLFVAGFILLFVLGGLSGVMTGLIPFDWQLTDSYFIVAHLHYVLIGINVFAVFAGFYYWLPKITGRMLSERAGRWNFWIMFIGFNLGFFPMHLLGILGMPRRVYTYPAGLGWDGLNLLTTVGAYVFAAGVLVFVGNFFWSLRRGEPAGPDPWRAGTLEWAVPSPPPPYNFHVIPEVRSRYPLWEQPAGEIFQATPPGRATLGAGRETPGTSVLDADPADVLHMPGDSAWPLILALALGGAFTGLLVEAAWLAAASGALALLSIAVWLWPAHAEAHA